MSEKEPKAQNEESEKTEEPQVQLKYPDGGWGWIIVLAAGISNFINIPVMQLFALIFKKRISELNIPSTDLATIIMGNAAFGMSLGIIAGPVLKRYGYRKVALFGAVSTFIGITTLSWADSFVKFFITYSLITSMGTFLLMSSFSLATNTYFRERRAYAAGMSTTLVGLGPIFMPHIIVFLLQTYSTQGTVLILGALSSHSILAALLLQPVKWHMKSVPIPPDLSKESKAVIVVEEKSKRNRTISNTVDPESDMDDFSIYDGMDTPVVIHRQFGSNQQISRRRKSAVSFYRSVSQNEDNLEILSSRQNIQNTNENSKSGNNIHWGNKTKMSDEKQYSAVSQSIDDNALQEKVSHECNDSKSIIDPNNHYLRGDDESESVEKKNNILKRIGLWLVDFFGLDLLLDPVYVILMLGMSMAICAEINFSLFTPLILGSYGFDEQPTANIMSTVAISDIIFRFIAPFVGDKLKFTAQGMYLISLIMLIITRTSLILFHDYTSAMIVACGLGVAKGFRTVYMGLVIPNYLPLDRLAHGSGIQSVVNCFFVIASIPIMSNLHDYLGNYDLCIVALNCITMMTVITWSVQLLYLRLKKRREKEGDEEEC